MTEDQISDCLDKYLSQTNLSMRQVAQRWGVSTPLLSQVKNKKKQPSLELGLKILRESGASLESRKNWLSNSSAAKEEIGIIVNDEKKKRIELKLKKSFSDLFENNPIMLDIFLDISLQKEIGLSRHTILKSYGEHGLLLASKLTESGIIKKLNDRYYVVEENIPHSINLESSLGIMSNIFSSLKQKSLKESFRGEFHFDLTDISEEGYEKLKELNLKFSKDTVEIIKDHEMSHSKGGIRILSQNIVSVLKCLAIVMLCTYTTQLSYAQGGGLTGGGSGNADYNEDDSYTPPTTWSSVFSNPPGSHWISVRCARRSTCYPPAGYKFRHFSTEIKGSDCKRRKVKINKDYIKTTRNCSVRGRVFVWPTQYCTGNYRFCN